MNISYQPLVQPFQACYDIYDNIEPAFFSDDPEGFQVRDSPKKLSCCS